MKTPEEIKKGLDCCYIHYGLCICDECPYNEDTDDCVCMPGKDAYIYICQLEHKIGELTKMVTQLEKERSALLADLREADMCECNHCAHYVPVGVHGKCGGYCWSCGNEDCPCKVRRENSNWEWRGVEVE